MTTTGWLGEEPEEPQAPGFAGFLLQQRADPGDGRTLEQVFERASRPDRPPEPPDPDEHAAAMVARGYSPGLVSQLSQQLGDTMAELAAEREKCEQAARRAEHVQRAHQAGQIHAWDIPAALDEDGDPGRVALLERRAGNLRRQLEEAQQMIAGPAQRAQDPVEGAVSRARDAGHRAFVETTRAKLAGTETSARRPFVSRAYGDGEFDVPACAGCLDAGIPADLSARIDHSPDRLTCTSPPGQKCTCSFSAGTQETEREELPEQVQRAEVDRLLALGYSWESAQIAATPYGAGMAVR